MLLLCLALVPDCNVWLPTCVMSECFGRSAAPSLGVLDRCVVTFLLQQHPADGCYGW